MLRLWVFRSYVSPNGRDVIQKWCEDVGAGAHAAFDVVLETLAQQPIDEWGRPEFAPLSGRHKKIGELRFDFKKLEYRPMGFFGPNRHEFTILIGATKKGKIYDPRDANYTAVTRMAEVIKNPGGTTRVWHF